MCSWAEAGSFIHLRSKAEKLAPGEGHVEFGQCLDRALDWDLFGVVNGEEWESQMLHTQVEIAGWLRKKN
jgi:hypothetical protein